MSNVDRLIVRKQLRPYQEDIVSRVSSTIGNSLVEAPTGAGKTFMAKEIIRREIVKGGSVLIVAPKKTLLKQLQEEFEEFEPATIHGKKKYDPEHNVFVSMLQTASNRELGFTPTMIIIDEIHYGFEGKMLEKLLDGFHGTIVGLSATPYNRKGYPLEGFDNHIKDYNLEYMIDNKYLVPIVSYQPVKVDLRNVKKTAGDYNLKDLDSKFNNIESVMQVVDATKEKILERNQALVFCINILHSEAMAEAYNDAGIPTKAMHSKMTKAEQESAMADFKAGKLKILTNPDMLTTGFDHPPVDTIVLARATKSQNLYKQIVGRGLRLHDGKTEAILLDCAGVITDLGLPTLPITPKNGGADTVAVLVCEECGEKDTLVKTIDNNKPCWICGSCGHIRYIESTSGYECHGCGKIHTVDSNFTTEDGILYLDCECGTRNKISESATQEELTAVFDEALIYKITLQIVSKYLPIVIMKMGIEFALSDEVKQHIDVVKKAIITYPEHALKILSDMESHIVENWKLIGGEEEKYFADLVIETESKDELENRLKDFSNSFTEAALIYNRLILMENKTPLPKMAIDIINKQIKHSNIDSIEKLTCSRLANIYFNHPTKIGGLTGFIKYIEENESKWGNGQRKKAAWSKS